MLRCTTLVDHLAARSTRHYIVIEYRLSVVPYVGKCAVTYSARPRLTANASSALSALAELLV